MDTNYEYDKWFVPDKDEQTVIRKAYRFQGYGLLLGYILLIIIFAMLMFYNILFQEINVLYIIIFFLLILFSVAGLGNQVKTVRQIRDREFEIRDGYVKVINYANNMKRGINSYDVEVNERNVIKTIVVPKEYRKLRPKEGDHIYIVRPSKTSNIYIYKRV
ncbi:MAG: hypothetical protein K5656_10955 [Lachnospiraceae bacterium]|nr:hypothetical protein [Lachnospiraceae bacterium]